MLRNKVIYKKKTNNLKPQLLMDIMNVFSTALSQEPEAG